MTSRYRLTTGLWLVSGVAGALVFWLVQVLAGGPTIPAFIGEQIATTGGYVVIDRQGRIRTRPVDRQFGENVDSIVRGLRDARRQA